MISNGSSSILSFTGDSRWAVAGLVVAVLLLGGIPWDAQIPATAQITENTLPDSPIRIGPVYFTPAFELKDVGFDRNVFNDDAEERDFTATPSAMLEGVMLFGPMRVTGNSNTDYVWYQEFRSERSINNDVKLRLEGFFDRLHPWVTGQYVRTRERVGFEIDSRAQRTESVVESGLDWVVGSRTSLVLSGRLARNEYAGFEQFEGASLSEQLDSEERAYRAGLRFEVTPLTALQVDGEYGTARFSGGGSVRDNDSWSVMPRLTFQPDAVISGELMVGYKTLTPKSPVLETFEGVVALGSLTMSLLDVTRVAVELERNTSYSFEELHPYYVQTGARLTITQQIGGPFDVQITGGRFELNYRNLPDPVAGPRGTEQLTMGGLGIGYQIGETIRLGVNGQFQKRRSILRRDRDYDRTVYYGSISYLL